MNEGAVVLAFLVLASAAPARADAAAEPFALTAASSLLLVLGPFSGSSGAGFELAADAALASHYAYGGGARWQLASGSPEVFARFARVAQIGAWRPAAGLEVGATGWDDAGSGGLLLAEARASAREELLPVYLALHATPLRFQLFERWALSTLDLQVGTHVSPFGRYLRLQVGLLALRFAP